MKMQDREELASRFDKASKRTDELIELAAKDIAGGRAQGKDHTLDFKLALSGLLAQRVNVESLLAISAELLYREAQISVFSGQLQEVPSAEEPENPGAAT